MFSQCSYMHTTARGEKLYVHTYSYVLCVTVKTVQPPNYMHAFVSDSHVCIHSVWCILSLIVFCLLCSLSCRCIFVWRLSVGLSQGIYDRLVELGKSPPNCPEPQESVVRRETYSVQPTVTSSSSVPPAPTTGEDA